MTVQAGEPSTVKEMGFAGATRRVFFRIAYYASPSVGFRPNAMCMMFRSTIPSGVAGEATFARKSSFSRASVSGRNSSSGRDKG
jgi:hypothetical protein